MKNYFRKDSPLGIYNNFETTEYLPWWGKNIKLELSNLAYSKMVHYTQKSRGEISGFGKMNKIGNRIIITNVKIFKQICTQTHTTLDEETLHSFLGRLIRRGENTGKWKLWWHSHNDFGVHWSDTDETNIARHSENSYLLSICINKNIDMIGRIDDKGQRADIPVKVLPIRGRLKENCYREVKRKVEYERFNRRVEICKELKKLDMTDNPELLTLENFPL